MSCNQSQKTYQELFQSIVNRCKDMNLELNVQIVVTDVVDAVLHAVAAIFGRNISHQGCFYHLTQATWRKIQRLGLMPHYTDSDEFRLFCGMINGLTFLPEEDIINDMHLLRTLCSDEPPECAYLLDYFDRTYVSGTFRQQQNAANSQHARLVIRRNLPMFPPSTSIKVKVACATEPT